MLCCNSFAWCWNVSGIPAIWNMEMTEEVFLCAGGLQMTSQRYSCLGHTNRYSRCRGSLREGNKRKWAGSWKIARQAVRSQDVESATRICLSSSWNNFLCLCGTPHGKEFRCVPCWNYSMLISMWGSPPFLLRGFLRYIWGLSQVSFEWLWTIPVTDWVENAWSVHLTLGCCLTELCVLFKSPSHLPHDTFPAFIAFNMLVALQLLRFYTQSPTLSVQCLGIPPEGSHDNFQCFPLRKLDSNAGERVQSISSLRWCVKPSRRSSNIPLHVGPVPRPLNPSTFSSSNSTCLVPSACPLKSCALNPRLLLWTCYRLASTCWDLFL